MIFNALPLPLLFGQLLGLLGDLGLKCGRGLIIDQMRASPVL
jgi:hypothetical protein